MRRGAPLALLVCAALGGSAPLAGCGAKTGLDVPDLPPDEPEPDICLEVPPDSGVIELPLETTVELARADVAFLIDVTLSMEAEIDGVRDQLRDTLAPAVRAEIPDVRFAVATLADFPVAPYGEPGDRPFTLMLPMTDDLGDAQAAVDRIVLSSGQDEAESQVEALYQLATGEGFGHFIDPSFGCPTGGYGYACFRDDALPIVLLFTDAPMHNGPGGAYPYGALGGRFPHSFDDASLALSRAGIRVIGLESGGGAGMVDLRQIAYETGAISSTGEPIVYDIGERGERLGTGVIDSIKSFAGAVVFDIDAVASDADPDDGIDALDMIDGITPLRADPRDGIDWIDTEAGVFRGVRSGTRVVFQLRVRSDAVVPGPTARRVLVEVTFRGNEHTFLGSQRIELLIPGADGVGCEENDSEIEPGS